MPEACQAREASDSTYSTAGRVHAARLPARCALPSAQTAVAIWQASVGRLTLSLLALSSALVRVLLCRSPGTNSQRLHLCVRAASHRATLLTKKGSLRCIGKLVHAALPPTGVGAGPLLSTATSAGPGTLSRGCGSARARSCGAWTSPSAGRCPWCAMLPSFVSTDLRPLRDFSETGSQGW